MEDSENRWRIGVVGNIVREHISADGTLWHGTRDFSGGTKVYIDGKNWYNYPRSEISVIGLARYKKYRVSSVDPALIENVRFQIIRKREVLNILDGEETLDGWYWWGRTADDKREAKKFVSNWESVVLESIANKEKE